MVLRSNLSVNPTPLTTQHIRTFKVKLILPSPPRVSFKSNGPNEETVGGASEVGSFEHKKKVNEALLIKTYPVELEEGRIWQETVRSLDSDVS